MSRKLKILNIRNGELKKDIRMLVLENEVFDWGLDQESIKRAKKMIDQKPDMKESIIMSILNHFLECFSDFCGKNITLDEFLSALEKERI
jgi:hypothetical protein